MQGVCVCGCVWGWGVWVWGNFVKIFKCLFFPQIEMCDPQIYWNEQLGQLE